MILFYLFIYLSIYLFLLVNFFLLYVFPMRLLGHYTHAVKNEKFQQFFLPNIVFTISN